MKKINYDELLTLYLLKETDETEKQIVENRLAEDEAYHEQYECLKQLYEALDCSRPKPASDGELERARKELLVVLNRERKKLSLFGIIGDWFANSLTTNYKLAFGSAFSLAAGLLIGYFVFNVQPTNPIINTNGKINVDEVLKNNIQISNIKFPNAISPDNKIEICFDAVEPIVYKGDINDKLVQRLLATALVTETNAGLRIKTINTISAKTKEGSFIPDAKIKKALIAALKFDNNPAVRKEALTSLSNFPFDMEIRDAFLFALSSDQNSGIRISAINALTNIKFTTNSLDQKIRDELNNRAGQDKNEFVKLRAASLLKEVQ